MSGSGPVAGSGYAAAIAAIDAANASDPTTVVVDGVARPKELVHAERMTAWVQRLDPLASEAQLLAARAHHLRRWETPRSAYPEGRAGYLRWRTDARARHVALVAELLADHGYGPDVLDEVQRIVGKQGLGRGGGGEGVDPAVQVHEDALCLVFLELQLDPVAEQLGDDHAVEVLAKTARKMSPAGRTAAGSLALSDRGRRLLEAALAVTA